MKTLPHSVETFFIELFRTNLLLKGKKFFHQDEDQPAATDCIIVGAVQGDHRLDGPKGWDVEVTVIYRAGMKTSAAQVEGIDQAISDSVFGVRRNAVLPTRDVFAPPGFLMLQDNATTERDIAGGRSTRRREKKFNVTARLKTQVENAASR